jgi:glucose/arabinose dehydrogenase
MQGMVAIAVAALGTLAIVMGSCTKDDPTEPPPPPASGEFTLETVRSGFNRPLFVCAPPGDTTRLFVVEQGGAIRVMIGDSLLATPFLTVTGLSNGDEQGLLGMAFSPDYATSGRFYVSYTDGAGRNRLLRYLVSGNPNVANPTPETDLLTVDQPYENHNGGCIAFGPDDYLYMGIGDGGGGGDPEETGQDRSDLLGSLLRLDVSGAGGYAIPPDNPFVGMAGMRGELWDWGLRNPWRFSFDRQTGDLYIADVGQNDREEVNVANASEGRGKGLNYGWDITEGFACFEPSSNCDRTGLTAPEYEYSHGAGCSITGGYVYRGSRHPGMRGRYFFGDYCQGWVRSFYWNGDDATHLLSHPALDVGTGLTSFGEDGRGELYAVARGGTIYRIVETTPP